MESAEHHITAPQLTAPQSRILAGLRRVQRDAGEIGRRAVCEGITLLLCLGLAIHWTGLGAELQTFVHAHGQQLARFGFICAFAYPLIGIPIAIVSHALQAFWRGIRSGGNAEHTSGGRS